MVQTRVVARCEEWIGALVDFPGFVEGAGEAAYRPTVVVWYEPESELIVDSELVRPEQALSRAAGLFHLATKEPKAGEPRIPRRVRVSDRALASALVPFVGDVEVVVAATPEIDHVVASMRDHFLRQRRAREQGSVSYLAGDVSARDVAQFFQAAAAFYAAAPWDVVPADAMISVRCEALGLDDGIAVVVGQLRQAFGVSLYLSVEDAHRIFALAKDAQRDGGILRNATLPDRHFMISFDGRDEVSADVLEEIEDHGWKVANPSAIPRPAVIEDDLASRTLTAHELAGVSAVLQALAITVRDTRREVRDAFDGGPPLDRPFSVHSEVGMIDVDIVVPAEHSRREDPLRWDAFDVATRPQVRAAVAIYTAALAGGINVELESSEADVLEAFVIAACVTFGAPLLRVTPAELRELVTHVLAVEKLFYLKDADAVFDLLTDCFERGVRVFDDRSAHACLRALSPALRKRFATALANAVVTKKPAKKKAKRVTKPKRKSKS